MANNAIIDYLGTMCYLEEDDYRWRCPDAPLYADLLNALMPEEFDDVTLGQKEGGIYEQIFSLLRTVIDFKVIQVPKVVFDPDLIV